MIFLQDNVLLERSLTFDDIKPRLLGHWGTCPGLVLVYAHLNRIIKKTGFDALLVVGPGELNFLLFDTVQVTSYITQLNSFFQNSGHGAPAILASLWLEDSLSPFWERYTRDRAGLTRLITKFSAPGGFPRFVTILAGCILSHHLHPAISMLKPLGLFMKVANLVMLSVSPSAPSWIIPILSLPALSVTVRRRPVQLQLLGMDTSTSTPLNLARFSLLCT